MNSAVFTRNVRLVTRMTFALTLVCGLPFIVQAQVAPSVRTITGVVEDKGHEPIHGAVVEVQNPATNSVQSYLTDDAGHYTFKRLDGNTDYRIWVTFRGHKSAIRSISKFDSHMAKTIDFTVETH